MGRRKVLANRPAAEAAAVEVRAAAALPSPASDFWYQSLTGANSPEAAFALPVVQACVRKLAELQAMLPTIVYRRLSDGGKERAQGSAVYRLLHDRPNPLQSAFEFRELMAAHLAFRGNAYARIVAGADGQIEALLPIHPNRVTPGRLAGGGLGYEITTPGQPTATLTSAEVFHLRDLSADGVEGISRIAASRGTLDVALAQDRWNAQLWKSGGRPSGYLKSPRALRDPNARDRMLAQWQEAYRVGAMGKVALLEEDTSFEALSLSAEDAQFIAQKAATAADICRLYGVPGWLIGLEAPTGTPEDRAAELVKFSLGPWIARWEQAVNAQLIDDPDLFAETLVDAFERASIGTRYTAHATALQNGWTTPNEVRRTENQPSMGPAGDVALRPANMVRAESLLEAPPVDPPAADPPAVVDPNPTPAKASGKTIAANPADNSHLRALQAWAADVGARLAAAERRELSRKSDDADFLRWAADWLTGSHGEYVERAAGPLLAVAGGDVAAASSAIVRAGFGSLIGRPALNDDWQARRAEEITRLLLEEKTDGT